jgi:hypothetical protein
MGFLDRLLGRRETEGREPAKDQPLTDEQALERYRYLLRTAPPEAIEQAHAQAFERLTPEQRAQVHKQLSQELPPAERAVSPQPDPQTLARMATRAELREPGLLERIFGPGRVAGAGGMGGMGMGGMFGGSLLSSIAGAFIGSAIAHQLLQGFHGDNGGGDWDHADRDEADLGDSDYGDSGSDVGGDF